MNPDHQTPFPDYDVRSIIRSLRCPSDDLVNVFCHRGLCLLNGSTENSLRAIAAAARAGWEGAEIDIRLTRDRQVVVFHDDGLGRLTDVSPPGGQQHYNPFTGRGHSPPVKETPWKGVMEHLRLRDDNGNVT